MFRFNQDNQINFILNEMEGNIPQNIPSLDNLVESEPWEVATAG